MNTIAIPITSEDQWLAERAKDVTSTEVPALYGLSPYVTEFELWHQKHEGFAVQQQDSERMRWGRRLEAAIAAGVAEDFGWEVRKASTYRRCKDVRLGASADFEVLNDPRGTGMLEVKNVDAHVFREQWHEHNGIIEAPPHIELQLQTQLEVSGFSWGCVVALVGGNTTAALMRERDPAIGKSIREKVAAFWRETTAPRPNYERDAEFIIQQLRRQANAGEVVTADMHLDALLANYREAALALTQAEARREAAKAEVLMSIGTAAKVMSRLGTLSCGTTKDSEGTLITPEMVGTYIGARRGFRQFRFTPKDQKP